MLNVLVNFFIKIILDVGEGILLSNFYYGSDNYDIRDFFFCFEVIIIILFNLLYILYFNMKKKIIC